MGPGTLSCQGLAGMLTPSEEQKALMAELRESRLWGGIHIRAKKDPGLQELLDRVVIYYRLKYEQR